MTTTKFDDIRPYFDEEVPAAMQRLAADPLLVKVSNFLMPGRPIGELQNLLRSINTVDEFQQKVMYNAITTIAERTTTGLTVSGIENLQPDKCYLFVSNHRDIVLDSAFLCILLVQNKLHTPQITFGSNLMKPQFVVDIGKSNKMFKVVRGANIHDFFVHSQHLSEYMRTAIEGGHDSIWIAQRNGRTKDGRDATDQGIIKMFAMSGEGDTLEAIKRLNIVPVSISYQIEPCDYLKAHEVYYTRRGPYVKSPMEDLDSILSGLINAKGHVHLHISPCINQQLDSLTHLTRNDLHKGIAKLIDANVQQGYRLYDTNYIAADLLCGNTKHAAYYTPEAKAAFVADMEHKLSLLSTNNDEIKQLFLEIYANPVRE